MARLKIFQKAEAPFEINRGKLSYKGRINKSYSIAQGTIINTLWQTIMEKNMGGVGAGRRNEHILVNQLRKEKKKKRSSSSSWNPSGWAPSPYSKDPRPWKGKFTKVILMTSQEEKREKDWQVNLSSGSRFLYQIYTGTIQFSISHLLMGYFGQYFDHLMRRTDSLEKTLMLGKIEGGRRRGQQRIRWLDGITTQWTWVWVIWWWTGRPGVLQSMGLQTVRHYWVSELNWIC